MTAIALPLKRGGSWIGRRVRRFWSGISAVSIKELRGRMRGRRAFVVLTIYLLLLGIFAFAVYVYLKSQAAQVVVTQPGMGIPRDFPGIGAPTQALNNGTALSAGIGHGIFGGLLFLETLLVLVLAPAFTTGAISLEREKQTLDLLVTTPLSTLGMVIGKLFSALTYVFLLIIASIPLASLVFVFGAVGPEELVRAYAFLFALAFGMGAIGLFISALVRRTQTATVMTFVVVLLLSIGTAAVHQFWQVATRPASSSTSIASASRAARAPEAALWLNPFVADADMICATSPDTYHLSCEYIASVTGRPYFGTPSNTVTEPGFAPPGRPPLEDFREPGEGAVDRSLPVTGPLNPGDDGSSTSLATTFGFPRDTFWPKSAASFLVLGIVLTLASAQLVAPTRRLRLPRRSFARRPDPVSAAASSPEHQPTETAE